MAKGSGRAEPGVWAPTGPLKPLPSLPILLTACHPPPPSPVTTPTGTRPRCSQGASACRAWPSRARRGSPGWRGAWGHALRRWTLLDQGLPARCPKHRDLGKREAGLSRGRGGGLTLCVRATRVPMCNTHAHTHMHTNPLHPAPPSRLSAASAQRVRVSPHVRVTPGASHHVGHRAPLAGRRTPGSCPPWAVVDEAAVSKCCVDARP